MKCKHLLPLLFILLVSSQNFAQFSLQGTIKDPQNQPVTGASIRLTSGTERKGTLSDNRGNFEFNQLSDSSYALTVSSVGFQTYQLQIRPAQSTEPLQITLQPSDILLQNVEVIGRARKDYTSDYSFSATKIAIKNKELPQALSTVTKELIADRGRLPTGRCGQDCQRCFSVQFLQSIQHSRHQPERRRPDYQRHAYPSVLFSATAYHQH